MKKYIIGLVVIVGSMILAACGGGSYPNKPITMMVPYRAGGGADTQARIIAAAMEETLGQPINVVNNPGAGGTVGTQELLASDADGYTIAFSVSSAVTINPIIQELEYSIDDIAVLGILSTFQTAIVTGGDAPYNTWDEFVAYAKENPGQKFMFLGPEARLSMEQIAATEGLEFEYVPAQGGADLGPALLSGDIDFGFSGGIHSRFLESGEMKVLLSMTSTGDLLATPDVPKSSDLYGTANDVQAVIVAPGDISDDVATALENAVKTASESSAYEEVLGNLQFPRTYMDAAAGQA
ncbi:MAG: tripartite tricarboxylate transporter substrate binding protein [Chloroflexota bacterium]